MSFTKLQFDALQGCLLWDGHLECRKGNACFQYASSSKQHTEYVHSFFKEFCTENYQTIKTRYVYDKRTNKTYTTHTFKTKCLPDFTDNHNRWYVNKVKVVPNDLVLNPIVNLFWYIGDGELESRCGYIKLHTNSFSLDEVEYLCSKLGFNSDYFRKDIKSGQHIIRVPRRGVSKFLKLIGKCPFTDYSHKWKQVPYKNKNIEKFGVEYHTLKYPSILEDWNTGNYTIYRLSKKHDIDIGCIKNYFKSNNIAYNPINTKKIILQFSKDMVFIREWSSLAEINRLLGYGISPISRCCRGLNNTSRGFIWKFKG